ncbi:YhgE/Pip domain-containing protein [Nocardia sp. NPDC056064]|uniref:YhgE/Pip domain-containing protein n=1 Tax=Nocardia sp. NPDC056064 TaxID=3345701 RepID=UPI0035DED6E0
MDTLRIPPRRWLRIVFAPTVVLSIVLSLLGVMYLAYISDPEGNLHDFPIALVNQDVGDTIDVDGRSQQVNFGKQVAEALVAGMPADQIDLKVVGISESERLMRSAQIYGAIVIPSDFSKRLGILGVGSVVGGEIERPIITVQTNPGMGPYSAGIVTRIGDRAMSEVNNQVGRQLTAQVRDTLAATPEGAQAPQISGAAQITLSQPIHIIERDWRPLGQGAGLGLTAFFYALLILMAGVVGAMAIHTMVDAQLGFQPTEYGPWYVHYPPTPISRFHTLLIKWGVMVFVAIVVSLLYLLVAKILGVAGQQPTQLVLFSVLALIAVGFTCMASLAAFGTAGLLINLAVFVILGLPSSSGTVPIQATPTYIAWLAEFEPMHQVYLGMRSILYFESDYTAGLGRGIWMSLLGLLIALIGGVVITKYYDYKGLHRENLVDKKKTAA